MEKKSISGTDKSLKMGTTVKKSHFEITAFGHLTTLKI